MKFNSFIFALLLVSNSIFAIEKTTIRIGVQATGTVAWELAALPENPDADFELAIQKLANPEAGKVALQSGAVDVIVSDWLWVSRLRSTGADFTFYPYSSTSGALMVPKDSPIHNVKDLVGKRLGIAGGELDKNWLLLQALAQHEHLDLNASVEKTMGAPPLLNEQILQKRVDALLTYWNFAAKLEAQGYRQIIDGKGILKGLGITENAPALGYVFKQSWADAHKQALKHFLAATSQAKNQLCTSDKAWHEILPLTQTEDATSPAALRQHYCEGTVSQWGEKEQQAAASIYQLLRQLSKDQLTGSAETLDAGTFWVQ
ncbi:MAG: ABC transporter substrate-binding protein [Methylovulum sp.]|uniref:ABC transporter substrate-binding protein n=1 Tax=Methylovulum sp. TaxID=1916980 RepID=UPI0026213E47|nr:ABC transporter substrate-binding protein [Methylovulum sp.]MDD2724527.1 ABC transporter substrate-binding protein [Methylovulum sp.]MDD5124042.1 ABC transporter substrate-binding protein [Methylovulum sp.]